MLSIPTSHSYHHASPKSVSQPEPKRLLRENVGDMIMPEPGRSIGPLRIVSQRKQSKIKDFSG